MNVSTKLGQWWCVPYFPYFVFVCLCVFFGPSYGFSPLLWPLIFVYFYFTFRRYTSKSFEKSQPLMQMKKFSDKSLYYFKFVEKHLRERERESRYKSNNNITAIRCISWWISSSKLWMRFYQFLKEDTKIFYNKLFAIISHWKLSTYTDAKMYSSILGICVGVPSIWKSSSVGYVAH